MSRRQFLNRAWSLSFLGFLGFFGMSSLSFLWPKLTGGFGTKINAGVYEDLLKDPDVDAVHINSPIADHAWMSIKALQAGKHVACTVPMATTVDECVEIIRLTQETEDRGRRHLPDNQPRPPERRASRATWQRKLAPCARFRCHLPE